MQLTHEQIKSITLGAAYVEFTDNKTVFHRFTKEQEALYQTVKSDFYNKTLSTSCVRLEFKTDSSYLFIKTQIKPRSSRKFYSLDVFVNGKFHGAMSGSINCDDNIVDSKEFHIGENGKSKTVRIHLPWSCSSDIIELSVDDGAFIEPVKKSKKMLCFGDSITQGYDATYTSNSYASKLTIHLDTETRNKGIGGEIFRPELASIKDSDFDPSIITVAYGTNDWAADISKDDLCTKIDGFFSSLVENYPSAKIFCIAPIWRADWQAQHSFGEFLNLKEELIRIAKKYPSITVINGFDFVPHECELFSDKYLHPNDDGFSHYAKNLISEIEKYL